MDQGKCMEEAKQKQGSSVRTAQDDPRTWSAKVNDMRESTSCDVYDSKGGGNGEFTDPTALAALQDGGLVAREREGKRFLVFKGLAVRFVWITACRS